MSKKKSVRDTVEKVGDELEDVVETVVEVADQTADVVEAVVDVVGAAVIQHFESKWNTKNYSSKK